MNKSAMHLCFACGGSLKLIAKPGRMTEDDAEELFEIPAELKIPTCLECGATHEDEFIAARIQRAIDSQKKQDPGLRIKMLRYLDDCTRTVLKFPRMWGDLPAVEAIILTNLETRQALLEKGEPSNPRKVIDAYIAFGRKRFPKHDKCTNPFHDNDLDLHEEYAPMMREFCDIVVNGLV